MFRASHEPLESKPKIGRKAENKVSKRTWRPGPAPAKPDNEVCNEVLYCWEKTQTSTSSVVKPTVPIRQLLTKVLTVQIVTRDSPP